MNLHKPTFALLIILSVLFLHSKSTDTPTLESYNPSFETSRTFNGCTKTSCAYCMESSDKTYTYCARCVNGLLKVPEDGDILKTKCAGEISISNCWEGNPIDPTKCIECAVNYYLTGDFKCNALNDSIKNCISGKTQQDGTSIKCTKCIKGYATGDGTYCTSKMKLLDNCIHGGILDTSINNYLPCVRCDDKFRVLNGACAQEQGRGCLKIHNKNINLCLMCNISQGYYAVDAEYVLGLNL